MKAGTKYLSFTLRLSEDDRKSLDQISTGFSLTKAQAVRIAIRLTAKLFANNTPSENLSVQTQRGSVIEVQHEQE